MNEYDGTDKDSGTKPHVLFLGVSSESRLMFLFSFSFVFSFLVAELSSLRKALWEMSSPLSGKHNQVVITQKQRHK